MKVNLIFRKYIFAIVALLSFFIVFHVFEQQLITIWIIGLYTQKFYYFISKSMEKYFQKAIGTFDCKVNLVHGKIIIDCLAADKKIQIGAEFTADNIPQNIKASIGQTAEQLYDFMQVADVGKGIDINSQYCMILAYFVGKRAKQFKLPLIKKELNETQKLKLQNQSLKREMQKLKLQNQQLKGHIKKLEKQKMKNEDIKSQINENTIFQTQSQEKIQLKQMYVTGIKMNRQKIEQGNYINEIDTIEYLQYPGSKELTKVDLSSTKVIDEQVERLCQKLPQLTKLNLSSCKLLRIIKLSSCSQLKQLIIQSTQIIRLQLQKMTSLSTLSLSSSSQLQQISLNDCQKLTNLDLSYTKVTDEQVTRLCQQLPQLTRLYLCGCKQLRRIKLSNCQQLGMVRINGTNICQLQLQKMPQILILYLRQSTQLQRIILKNCPKVTYLDLMQAKIDDQELQNLRKQLPSLQSLLLYGCFNLNKFQCLGNLRNIHTLDLGCTSITDDGLTYLANKLLQLEELLLYGCVSIKQYKLQKFNKLNGLYLGNSSIITDQIVQRLGKQLPLLQYLQLTKCPSLKNPSFDSYASLKSLELSYNISLKQRIPALKEKYQNFFINFQQS